MQTALGLKILVVQVLALPSCLLTVWCLAQTPLLSCADESYRTLSSSRHISQCSHRHLKHYAAEIELIISLSPLSLFFTPHFPREVPPQPTDGCKLKFVHHPLSYRPSVPAQRYCLSISLVLCFQTFFCVMPHKLNL